MADMAAFAAGIVGLAAAPGRPPPLFPSAFAPARLPPPPRRAAAGGGATRRLTPLPPSRRRPLTRRRLGAPSPPAPSTSPASPVVAMARVKVEGVDLGAPIAVGSYGDVYFGTDAASGAAVVLKRANRDPLAQRLLNTERHVYKKLERSHESAASRRGGNGADGASSDDAGVAAVGMGIGAAGGLVYDGGASAAAAAEAAEAAAAAAPFWPRYLGDAVVDSSHFLVWAKEGEGATLEDYLGTRPATDLAAAVGSVGTGLQGGYHLGLFRRVMGLLLRAVGRLHDEGLIHRDIKPSNVIVNPADTVAPLKLIDMGSCCDWSSPFKRGIRTHTLDPLYGAPEQRLSLAAPFAFDVFSLALVGLRVLLPAYASEARLRELRSRLEPLDYDLYAYREAVRPGGGGVGGGGGGGTGGATTNNVALDDLALLALSSDPAATAAFDLLAGMMRAEPRQRRSAEAAVRAGFL